ncbi:MAG TPA: hypothetical protein DEF07_00980 [Nitrosomonas sp.]|nr:hypothetical protein [Nitrosomonas sp.]
MWIQTRMWMVEFGAWRVAAGGGEYMLALFLGVPTLLMALACLGATVIKRTWRSFLSCLAFIMALVPFFGWLVLIVKEIL